MLRRLTGWLPSNSVSCYKPPSPSYACACCLAEMRRPRAPSYFSHRLHGGRLLLLQCNAMSCYKKYQGNGRRGIATPCGPTCTCTHQPITLQSDVCLCLLYGYNVGVGSQTKTHCDRQTDRQRTTGSDQTVHVNAVHLHVGLLCTRHIPHTRSLNKHQLAVA